MKINYLLSFCVLLVSEMTFAEACPKPAPVKKPEVKAAPLPPPPKPIVVTKEVIKTVPVTQYVPLPTTQPSNTNEKDINQNIIVIDQSRINERDEVHTINHKNKSECDEDELKAAKERIKDLRAIAKKMKKKSEEYRKAYLKEKEQREVLEKKEKKSGISGFYLGVVVGAGPDGVIKDAETSDEELVLVEQDYRPFVGGRLMGVMENGVAAGLQINSNASVSFDVSFRIK